MRSQAALELSTGLIILRGPSPRELVAVIEVRHLSKSFHRTTAVDDISFTVQQGDVFAFLGPNGAGKSTTVKMLTTLLRPSSGAIRLNGHDALTEQRAVRRSIGVVFQASGLDEHMTAREHMEQHGALYEMRGALCRSRTQQLLKLVGLWDLKDRRPSTFSGGMRRRLELARSFLHCPRILFLDEPTAGLDPQSRQDVWNHIRVLNEQEGTTVFFTTHYMEEADRMAEHVAIINSGRIVAQDTPVALKALTAAESLEQAFLTLTVQPSGTP